MRKSRGYGNNDPERPLAGAGYTRTLRHMVEGKNIHPVTLLATDYLNHFNEIIMMLDMVAAMPAFLEEVRQWQPKSYTQHFRDSGFQDRELAILAYENAPARYRYPFDALVAGMNTTVLSGIRKIGSTIQESPENPEPLDKIVENVVGALKKDMQRAGALINGDSSVCEEQDIDALLHDDP